jgi:CheY-like chemotaxis protein
MSAEPTSKIQKITKSIELLLKTVLTGFASNQLQVLLGRRLLAKGKQDGAGSQHEEAETQVNVPSHALAAASSLPGSAWERNPALSQAELGSKGRWRDNSRETLATILIVEPNPVTREVMRRALRGEGYRVLEAENGQSALRIMANGVPHLLLQNPVLPDMQGTGLIQWLRALPGGLAVPILAVAEDAALLEKTRASRAGFTGFLCKPFLPSRLLQTVCFYFPSRSSTATVPPHLLQRQPAAFPSGTGETAKRRNGENLVAGSPIRPVAGSLIGRRILVVEDNGAPRQALVANLSQLGMDVATADNGREALELAKSWLPDAIICDTLMSGLDGFELCLAVRMLPRLANITVILRFAGLIAEVDQELAKEIGVSALVSPDPVEVIRTLVTCLKDKPAGTERRSQDSGVRDQKSGVRGQESGIS